MKLNDRQTEAVMHKEGPMMVLAGPGSGKTMVITHRIHNLINNCKIEPSKILVITFTKAAALEMKTRFEKMDTNRTTGITFGTCHAVFFSILKHAFDYTMTNILKEEEKYKVIRELVHKLKIDFEDEKEIIEDIKSDISAMKNELIKIENYNPMGVSKEDFEKIIQYYEGYKKKHRKIDFDDMLTWTYMLFKRNPEILKFYQKKYEYILVDEFQDINKVQFEIIKMLAEPNQNLFVVGDDDQSIYRFRGAKPEIFLNFPTLYEKTKKVTLEFNYRSTSNIVKAASSLIKNNSKRFDKQIKADNHTKVKTKLIASQDVIDEVEKIMDQVDQYKKEYPYKSIAIIYRTNIQARNFVEKLMDLNIPFNLKDEVPDIYSHWIVNDIVSYIRASQNGNDKKAVARIINRPNRYINKYYIDQACGMSGDVLRNLQNVKGIKNYQIDRVHELDFRLTMIKDLSFDKAVKYIREYIDYDKYLEEYAQQKKIGKDGLLEVLDEFQSVVKGINTMDEYLEHVTLIRSEMIKSKRNLQGKEGIVLTTMHSAKGLEFDIVFIAGVAEGIIPHEKSMKQDYDIEEERRLMYVAMTRAKKHLYISTLKSRHDKDLKESRFIKEIAI